jgi:hypothetical protein
MVFIASHPDTGERVDLPMDFEFARTVKGRLPNDVTLTIDERKFDKLFGRFAAWVTGSGPYVSLAYCAELTIQRYATLEDAITAKRTIDSIGCGGGCAKVHLIVYCDPANSEHEAQQQRIREYIAQHGKVEMYEEKDE